MLAVLAGLLLIPALLLLIGVLTRAFYRPKPQPFRWMSADEWDVVTAEKIAADEAMRSQPT